MSGPAGTSPPTGSGGAAGYMWYAAVASGHRVEVARRGLQGVLVRYSRYPGVVVEVPLPAWRAFVEAVKDGGFDDADTGRPGGPWVGYKSELGRGRVEVAPRGRGTGARLRYSERAGRELAIPVDPWRAFLGGVKTGMFDPSR